MSDHQAAAVKSASRTETSEAEALSHHIPLSLAANGSKRARLYSPKKRHSPNPAINSTQNNAHYRGFESKRSTCLTVLPAKLRSPSFLAAAASSSSNIS